MSRNDPSSPTTTSPGGLLSAVFPPLDASSLSQIPRAYPMTAARHDPRRIDGVVLPPYLLFLLSVVLAVVSPCADFLSIPWLP